MENTRKERKEKTRIPLLNRDLRGDPADLTRHISAKNVSSIPVSMMSSDTSNDLLSDTPTTLITIPCQIKKVYHIVKMANNFYSVNKELDS